MMALLTLVLSISFAAPFTEKDLRRVLADAKTGGEPVVFYLWSPHMYLSINGLNDLRRTPQGLTVIPILDPGADKAVAEQIQIAQKWPTDVLRTLNSESLLERGALTHYPNYTFAKDGRLVGPTIAGYKHQAGLLALKRKYLR